MRIQNFPHVLGRRLSGPGAIILVALGAATSTLLTQTAPTCSQFNFDTASGHFSAAGGQATVTCTKGPLNDGVYTGCAWTASVPAAGDSWITILGGAASNSAGIGIVTYQVQANPSTTSRTGTILFTSGQYNSATYKVTQDGAVAAPVPALTASRVITLRYNTTTKVIPPPVKVPVVAPQGAMVNFQPQLQVVSPPNVSWVNVTVSSPFDSRLDAIPLATPVGSPTSTPAVLNVSLNSSVTSLKPGSYLAVLSYATGQAPNVSPQDLGSSSSSTLPSTSVILSVGPGPPIFSDPQELLLDDSSAPNQPIRLDGTSVVTSFIQLFNGPDGWLTVSPPNPPAGGYQLPRKYIASVASGLPADGYTGVIAFTDVNTNAGTVVEVDLAVGAGVITDQASAALAAQTSAAPPSTQSIFLNGDSLAAVSVEDIFTPSWVTVPSQIQLPGALTIGANPQNVLGPGDYAAAIVVTPPDAPAFRIPVSLSVSTPSGSPRRQLFPFVSSMPQGGSTLILVNSDTQPAVYTLSFMTDQGQPLALPIGGQQMMSVSGMIPVSGSKTISIDPGPSVQGWAELQTTQAIGGTAIFPLAGKAPSAGSASLNFPAMGRFVAPFDDTQSQSTRIWIVNPAPQSTTATVLVRDSSANLLVTTNVIVPGRGRNFLDLQSLPVARGLRGTAEVFSLDSELAGIVLQTNNQQLTGSIPVFTESDLEAGVRHKIVPELIFGGGSTLWQPTLTIYDADIENAEADLNFYDQNGNPLPLNIPNTLNATLTPAASSTSILDVNLNGQGWLDIFGNVGMAGFVGMSGIDTANQLYQFYAPFLASPLYGFRMPFEIPAGYNFYIFLANPEPQDVDIALTYWDCQGNQILVDIGTVGANSQIALELDPSVVGPRGIAEFISDGGVQGLGLRLSSGQPADVIFPIPR